MNPSVPSSSPGDARSRIARLRGTFMSLNSAVQSAAMGVAALVGGLIIGRDAQGHLTHYWVAGLMGSLLSLATLWLVSRVRVHGIATSPR